MWHIMVKVADKLPISLRGNESFTKKFNALVWSEVIEPAEFEKRCNAIISEFDLTGIK